MPIVWTQPESGQVFGPGYEYFIGTSLNGPWPAGSHWWLDIYPAVGEQAVASHFVSTQSGQIMGQMGAFQTPLGYPRPRSILAPGGAARLVAVFYDNNNTVIDQDTLDIVWEPTSGSYYLLSQQLDAMRTFGSFTAGDRLNLAATKSAVQLPIPLNTPSSGTFVAGLADFFGKIPTRWLSRVEGQLLSGSGSLTRPGAIYGVDCYGCSWDFFTIPSGYGLAIGTVNEYYERMVQLSLVKKDGISHLFSADLTDWRTEGNYYVWGIDTGERLDYAIAPGVSIMFYWLVFTIPV